MSNKKLIKRCKQGDAVEKSDNTRVQMPRTDVQPIYYEPAALIERAIRKQPQSGALTPVYPEFELLMGLRGLSTSFRPKKKLQSRHFKDPYGREVIPTPYNGPDSDLIEAVSDSQKQVLVDYFSENKINQIKKTMGWGDSEISELQDEIIRAIGNKSDVKIKGPQDGFTIIGQHQGKIVGSGPNAEGVHIVTLNRERVPNLQAAQEAGIHELGVHGKTLSMQAEDFGKAGYSDQVRGMFPRLAQITQKNADMADEILEFNRLGNYLNQFKTTADLEKYFVEKGIPFDKWDKFNNNRRYFNYVHQADEKTARAYTGQLYEKVYGNNKTENIQQLERFFTPESVERFKKAVLSVTPIGFSLLLNEE